MKTYGPNLPNPRFRQIDEINISDHSHLTSEDQCYYLWEFTSGTGYSNGQGNQLITNLKKSPLRRDRPEYRYKVRAIRDCAGWLAEAISDDWLRTGTLIPVPPSKARDHEEYDDRMVQVVNRIQKPFPVDVRELVVQTETIRAAHESPDNRPTVTELVNIYVVDESLADPTPEAIAVVDDVLTAGTHYRAMRQVLLGRFPDVPIVGLFIARRVFPTANHEDF